MRQRPVTETSSRHRARAANHRGFSSFIGGYLGLGVTTPAAAGTAAVATVAVVAAAGAIVSVVTAVALPTARYRPFNYHLGRCLLPTRRSLPA